MLEAADDTAITDYAITDADADAERVLARAPFRLDPPAIAWVIRTRRALKGRRRLAQLFNVLLKPGAPELASEYAELQPGGVTQYLIGGVEPALAAARGLAARMEVPLLVSSDVEGGAFGLPGTTPMPNQLGMAALPSAQAYDEALAVMVDEARALGINWSFTPVIDINAEFRSTVVGTRSFGSDPARIERLATAHIRRLQSEGFAATAKHWPGEGFDARDQHLVTTVNPLSVDDWRQRFEALYRSAIAQDVMTIMSGHIAFPAYARSRGATGLEAFRPASVSRLLNTDLLRGELGFNGLITSDATEMGGLHCWARRDEFLPEVIASGCDMILFASDLPGDIARLEAALQDGRLSEARIDEALTRVLGLKAWLRLHEQEQGHERPSPGAAAPHPAPVLRTPENLAVGDRTASLSITLVKDVQRTLPIGPRTHRRVTLVTPPARESIGPFKLPQVRLGELLAERGFEVRPYRPDDPPTPRNTDLVLYVLPQESMLTTGAIYLDWVQLQGPMGDAMWRPWHELPTVLVSLGHPYFLNEAPRMPCVINAYSAIEPVQRAVVRKLLGEEPFTGGQPVDAFCGHEDARY